MRLRPSQRGRATWSTAALLASSLLATTLLAILAYSLYLYHRATAERVLRDFARLAAGELVQRTTARAGYEGFLALTTALGRRLEVTGLPAEVAGDLARDGDRSLLDAAVLVRRPFAAVPGGGLLAFAGEPPPLSVRQWLLAELQRRSPISGPFAAVHGILEDEPRTFVVAPVRGPGEWELVGFEVDLSRLGGFLAPAVDRAPLLPAYLGGGAVGNDSLAVSVRDHGGVERLRRGGGPQPDFAAEVAFGEAYSGVLEGFVARVSIAPAAAGRLVVGGLPRSPAKIVLGLVAVALGTVGAAFAQLRRERALQRLREEFVASVSHELRTPLTQVRVFAETLVLDRTRSAEERQRALEIIDREARRLTHLVENVLQYSRGERGDVTLVRERQRLAPLVREALEQIAPLTAGAEAKVVARLDDDASAPVDAGAFRQVLLNLLDNALKYGPPGQELRVGVERDEAAVRLWVDDEGAGVPPRERRRIFERFHRLARHRRSAVAGAGIGLAVVRDLVARHDGRVFVEEGGRGGARFVVELPS